MNDTSNKYAFAALKDKRATLAGEIALLKRRTKMKLELLAHVDATIKVFEPDYDVDKIPLKRPRSHVNLFPSHDRSPCFTIMLRRC